MEVGEGWTRDQAVYEAGKERPQAELLGWSY